MDAVFNLSGPHFLICKMRIITALNVTRVQVAISVQMQDQGLLFQAVLYVLPAQGRTWLQDVQLLTKGDGEATAGGSCYVLFNRVYLEMLSVLSRRFDHTDVPDALIFVVTGQPLMFNETKMTQIKCDGEGRGRGAKLFSYILQLSLDLHNVGGKIFLEFSMLSHKISV